ncbi:MAG TPA: fibronectin type III-like domain-contianing protein, partial [Ruminiclostridium sp.]
MQIRRFKINTGVITLKILVVDDEEIIVQGLISIISQFESIPFIVKGSDNVYAALDLFAVRNHSLCAFKRVALAKGESKEVVLELSPTAFEVVNEQG